MPDHAVASLVQATPFAVSIGETSLILFFAIALIMRGQLHRHTVLLGVGLLSKMLKPQAGLLLLVFAMTQSWSARPAMATLLVLGGQRFRLSGSPG